MRWDRNLEGEASSRMERYVELETLLPDGDTVRVSRREESPAGEDPSRADLHTCSTPPLARPGVSTKGYLR